jgi:hypothetical protein
MIQLDRYLGSQRAIRKEPCDFVEEYKYIDRLSTIRILTYYINSRCRSYLHELCVSTLTKIGRSTGHNLSEERFGNYNLEEW